MSIKIIDTHCHLDMEEFDDDRDDVIARSRSGGVKAVVMPSTVKEDFEKENKLCDKYKDSLFYLVGVHPHDARTCLNSTYDEAISHLDGTYCKGIGEIGLDYYYEHSPKEIQKKVFSDFLDIAIEKRVPVSIHSREATDDMVDILSSTKGLSGVIHCFSGEEKLLKVGLDTGLYFGIGGVLTFKKSILRDAIKYVPAELIVFETDAPYLSPVPKRGKRNEPIYIKYVARELSLLFKEKQEKLFDTVYENSKKVFDIDCA